MEETPHNLLDDLVKDKNKEKTLLDDGNEKKRKGKGKEK